MSPVTPTAAPAKPDPATVQASAKLVEASRKRLDKTLSAPSSDCAAVPAPERKRIRKAVTQWMDKRNPGEKDAPASLEGVGGIAIGCADPDGVLVSVGDDRIGKREVEGYKAFRRNFVLRVAGDQIDVIADRTSTASMNWMEWADEGGYGTVGTLDFDGDGKRDTIYLDEEHEGGAMHDHSSVMVRTAGGSSPRRSPRAT